MNLFLEFISVQGYAGKLKLNYEINREELTITFDDSSVVEVLDINSIRDELDISLTMKYNI